MNLKKELKLLLLNWFPQFFSIKLYWSEKLSKEEKSVPIQDSSEALLLANNIIPNKIYDGIFKGLKYDVPSLCSEKAPKVIGSYEDELTEKLEQVLNLNPVKLINIGSAEGYYAVGIAKKCSGIQIIAVDPSLNAKKALMELAAQNGMEKKINFKHFLSRTKLNTLIDKRGTLLLVDCEGCELGYLNPVLVPKLKYTNVLVETHDFVYSQISSILLKRFEKTHHLEIIEQQKRSPKKFPSLAKVDIQVATKLLDEQRPKSIKWILMIAKSSEFIQ